MIRQMAKINKIKLKKIKNKYMFSKHRKISK